MICLLSQTSLPVANTFLLMISGKLRYLLLGDQQAQQDLHA